VAKLAEMGWDPRFGARPVKRVIQREVQDRLADGILSGDVVSGSLVELGVEGDGGFGVRVVGEERADEVGEAKG
jgi:ATP-dependent Clp protease ATP-binding subunit ClpA